MDGLSSFYPVVEGLDYLVNSDNEVALFEFINLHSYKEYQCKVKKADIRGMTAATADLESGCSEQNLLIKLS